MALVWKKYDPLRRLVCNNPSSTHFIQSKVFMAPPCSRRTEEEVKAIFEEWMIENGRSYSSVEEKESRFRIFKDNLRTTDIRNLTTQYSAWRISWFADLTYPETRRKFGYHEPPYIIIDGPETSHEQTNEQEEEQEEEEEEEEGKVWYIEDISDYEEEEEEETDDEEEEVPSLVPKLRIRPPNKTTMSKAAKGC